MLAGLLDGRRLLLTLDEIRRANSGDGLTVALFPIPLGHHGWDDAEVGQLRRLAPQAMVRAIGGYRLRAIYDEAFTDEVARYIQAGGHQLLHDFSALAGTGFLRSDSRPRMLRLTRADLPPGAMSMASQMFDPPRAVLGLTPAEQRVALKALDGASDRALAEALGLSPETVHARWRSIYERLSQVIPAAKTPASPDGGATRGVERRRAAARRDRIPAAEHARAAPLRELRTQPWRHVRSAWLTRCRRARPRAVPTQAIAIHGLKRPNLLAPRFGAEPESTLAGPRRAP